MVTGIGCLANLQATEVAIDGAEVGKWTQDFQAASELAKEKNLPILLNFTGSDWCGWCKLMDATVYGKPEWAEYASNNVVLVTVDFPRDKTIVPEKFVARNEELKAKYAIPGFPTYIIVDSDGETKLGRLQAGEGKTAAFFIEEVRDVLQYSQANIAAKVAALGEAKGNEYRDAINAVKTAEADLYAWFATEPALNDENDKKFTEFKQSIADARAAVASF